jgi:hypothetical protein
MLDSCRFLFSWNLWIMLVISWALWALIVMHHILLLSWKCWDDYIYCCCRFIYSSFSLCQILGSVIFCCDGCVICLANLMMGHCCCWIIFSGFSLCLILGFDKFYCDGCVDCLANVMMCCFFERIWTTLGVASFLCWIIITLGRDLTRSCSMPLILDELVCAIFSHLSYG